MRSALPSRLASFNALPTLAAPAALVLVAPRVHDAAEIAAPLTLRRALSLACRHYRLAEKAPHEDALCCLCASMSRDGDSHEVYRAHDELEDAIAAFDHADSQADMHSADANLPDKVRDAFARNLRAWWREPGTEFAHVRNELIAASLPGFRGRAEWTQERRERARRMVATKRAQIAARGCA